MPAAQEKSKLVEWTGRNPKGKERAAKWACKNGARLGQAALRRKRKIPKAPEDEGALFLHAAREWVGHAQCKSHSGWGHSQSFVRPQFIGLITKAVYNGQNKQTATKAYRWHTKRQTRPTPPASSAHNLGRKNAQGPISPVGCDKKNGARRRTATTTETAS